MSTYQPSAAQGNTLENWMRKEQAEEEESVEVLFLFLTQLFHALTHSSYSYMHKTFQRKKIQHGFRRRF